MRYCGTLPRTVDRGDSMIHLWRRACAVGGLMLACLLFLASGALAAPPPVFTPVIGSPFHNLTAVLGVAFSPNGALLATAHPNFDAVVDFSVGAGGVLTPAGSATLAGGARPSSVAFSPSGGLLAASNAGNGMVSVLSVSTTGALAPAGSATIGAGIAPASVAFSPSGALLASANQCTNTVSVFSVFSVGVLTPVGLPVATGTAPFSVAFRVQAAHFWRSPTPGTTPCQCSRCRRTARSRRCPDPATQSALHRRSRSVSTGVCLRSHGSPNKARWPS